MFPGLHAEQYKSRTLYNSKMGLFDLFRSFSDETESHEPRTFSSFSSKIVKVICRKDENGLTKCERVTQTSSDPNNSTYEETREDYTKDLDSDLINAFNDITFKFGFGHDLFSEIENEFENLFSSQNLPFRRHRFHPDTPQNFPNHPEYKEKDTNIYDI